MTTVTSRTILTIAAIGLLIGVVPCVAGERAAEIRLNGDLFEAGYLHYFEQRDAVWSLSALHRSDRGDAVSTTFHVFGPVSSKPRWAGLRAGMGGEAIAVDLDGGGSGLAVGIGGYVSYVPASVEKLSLRLDARWAPDILAFGDIEEYTRIAFEVGYDVISRGTVFVGARTLRVESDGERDRLDSGVHAGFRIRF